MREPFINRVSLLDDHKYIQGVYAKARMLQYTETEMLMVKKRKSEIRKAILFKLGILFLVFLISFILLIRITSYNVCYTKLLRVSREFPPQREEYRELAL